LIDGNLRSLEFREPTGSFGKPNLLVMFSRMGMTNLQDPSSKIQNNTKNKISQWNMPQHFRHNNNDKDTK
jgi:hypothetical protein